MKYAYKTEIKPTAEQAQKIKRSLGICRWLYNQYIEANKRLYRMYQRGLLDKNQSYFMTANDFDKYVNHKLKTKKEYIWLNKCGSKARKKALMNAEAAFRNFFAGNTAFPKFKKKTDEDVKLYFPKNNAGDWLIERHRIKIPTLKYVRLKEYGYLPTNAKVINGSISCRAGRFYVSITVEENTAKQEFNNDAIGLNISISDLNDSYINKLQKKLNLQRRRLARKYQCNKLLHDDTSFANKEKQRKKIKKLEQKIEFIKEDYLNKQIAEIIKRKPEYIVIENLNAEKTAVSKQIKKITVKQKYYHLKNKLLFKCIKYGIELKQTDEVANITENTVSIKIPMASREFTPLE